MKPSGATNVTTSPSHIDASGDDNCSAENSSTMITSPRSYVPVIESVKTTIMR